MVLFFTPTGGAESGHLIYMGRDKVENEDLIRWGFPTDIWFHVDKLSSAHVYLRLSKGQTIADITKEELEDCAQLVKANSIQGNKENNLTIVFTPWGNLKKTGGMDVGQVGFHAESAVKRTQVAARSNEIVNRLNKTKVELFPNLQQEREKFDQMVKAERKAEERSRKKEELEEQRERQRQEELRSYNRIMTDDKMVSNKEVAAKYASFQEAEDDFM